MRCVRNKKGDMTMNRVVAIVIAVVVIFLVVSFSSKSFGKSTSDINAFSLSNNGVLFGNCNDYCGVIRGGTNVASILGADSKRLYCNEKRPFVADDGKKYDKTCYEMSLETEFVDSCTC